jgi:hypothetical protein
VIQINLEAGSLPTITTVAAAAAIPTTIAATSTATPAPAATAVTSTTTAAVAPAPAPTAAPFRLWPRFIYHQIPAAKILSVQGIDRALRVFVIRNFDERESARLSRKPVTDQVHTRGSNTDLRKPFVELIFRRGKRKIPDIKLLHLLTPSARNPSASRGAR